MSEFPTPVPIAEVAVKQAVTYTVLGEVSENGQYTYIFVHVGLCVHMKVRKTGRPKDGKSDSNSINILTDFLPFGLLVSILFVMILPGWP